MYKIVRKKVFNPTETLMEIEAPLIAKKAQPGTVRYPESHGGR
jgi:ferredoxin--NADP+ reductase